MEFSEKWGQRKKLTQHVQLEASERERWGRGRHRRRLQSVVIVSRHSKWPLNNGGSHLHGAAIDVESIELLGSLQGSVGLDKDDRSNATAGTVLVVCEHHSLDGTCRLGKVFL